MKYRNWFKIDKSIDFNEGLFYYQKQYDRFVYLTCFIDKSCVNWKYEYFKVDNDLKELKQIEETIRVGKNPCKNMLWDDKCKTVVYPKMYTELKICENKYLLCMFIFEGFFYMKFIDFTHNDYPEVFVPFKLCGYSEGTLMSHLYNNDHVYVHCDAGGYEICSTISVNLHRY